MNYFQTKLNQIMLSRNLKQNDIAELAGVSQYTVSKWHNQGVSPNLKHVEPLAKALGVKVSELLGDYSGGMELSEADKQLLALPNHRKDFVLKMLALIDEDNKNQY